MNVVMFSPVFYPELSGVSNHVLFLAKKLLDFGFNVKVYTLCHKNNLPTHEVIDGIEVFRITSRNEFFVYDVAKKLSKYTTHERPDIVHFHCILSGLTALITEKPKESKFVVTLHTLWDANKEYYIPSMISDIQKVQSLVLTSPRIDGYISVSEYIRNIAIEHRCNPSKIVTIYNGIDISMFENIKNSKNSNSNTVLILSRLSPEKGIYEFLKEFSKHIDKLPRLKLKIIGPIEPKDSIRIEYLSKLKKLIEDNNLYNIVEINSEGVDYAKVPKILSECGIVINPSFHEGLSMVILESMAASRPVIAFNICGNNEIIKSRVNGILVEPLNYDEMINSIKLLLENPELRWKMGQKAYITVKSKFTVDNMAREVIRFYDKI